MKREASVLELIENGAEIDDEIDSIDGMSIFMNAVKTGRPSIIQVLIKHHPDFDRTLKSDIGMTLLHYAAELSVEICKILVEAGCDSQAKDNQDRTPAMCATDLRVQAYFKQIGAY